MSDYRRGFGLVIGFIELLQVVTISKDYALAVLHTSQITIGHITSSHSVIVFTSRCLVAACNGERSSSCGFPNCPRPRLPACHSNSLTTEPQRLSNATTHLSCL
jgi:hypothetical protein